MAQPAAEEKETPVDPVAHNLARVRNRAREFRFSLRRQDFVSVEDENPIVLEREMLKRPIFLFRPDAIEFKLHHFRSKPLGNFRRAIRALRIDNENFVRPLHAAEATRQISGLVFDWNQHRDRYPRSHRAFRTLHGLPAAMTFSGTSCVTT